MVNRLKPRYGFPGSVSAKYLGKIDNVDSTRHYALLSAQTLKEMGFNVNFAPVVDVDLNPQNPVIGKYERSFSDKAETVIEHASIWVQVQGSLGIISTLKHFPGHGSSEADSHMGVTDITGYWNEKELRPFREIGKSGNSVAIMTAHVVNKNLDPTYPATLSEKVITGILREEFGFDGLMFSDDLQMKAVNEWFDFETILKRSIEAGVDILVFGNNLEYDEQVPEKAVNAIQRMVDNGEISNERIKKSYDRIMKMKEKIKR
jgi:beta-N-acetylhexosaminidase